MGKKIEVNELLEKTYTSNSYGDFTVKKYIGKEKDHMYEIVFSNTNNIEVVTRKNILACSCVDKKEKERISKENKKTAQAKEFQRRRQMNKFKGKEIHYVENPDNIVLLALDQSTGYTGFSIFKGKKLLHYGVIDLKTNEYSYLQKALVVEEMIEVLIKEYKVNLVCMEDIYLGMNLEVFKVLCTLQSYLMLTFIKREIDYIIVSAPQWKSFAGISQQSHERKKQKALGLSIVNRKYNLSIKQDDISDAILIGEYAIGECIKVKQNTKDGEFSWDLEAY